MRVHPPFEGWTHMHTHAHVHAHAHTRSCTFEYAQNMQTRMNVVERNAVISPTS